MAKADVGVVTMYCGYCGSKLENVGTRVAFNHVHSCARKAGDPVTEVKTLLQMMIMTPIYIKCTYWFSLMDSLFNSEIVMLAKIQKSVCTATNQSTLYVFPKIHQQAKFQVKFQHITGDIGTILMKWL